MARGEDGGGSEAGSGGGVGNGGTLTITNSTLSGNEAIGSDGGGVWNSPSGTVTITNSTLSGNSASFVDNQFGSSGHGGGVDNYGGTLTLARTLRSGASTGLAGSIPCIQT